ncbi:MAG: hypothetical protein IJY58_04090 [Alphaproteobacteria bacterium]|nr:hypothetical protein [Alphaproteobacteria bacterium]
MSKFNYVDEIVRINNSALPSLDTTFVSQLPNSFFDSFKAAQGFAQTLEQNKEIRQRTDFQKMNNKDFLMDESHAGQISSDVDINSGLDDSVVMEANVHQQSNIPDTLVTPDALTVAKVAFDTTLTPDQRQARLLSNGIGQKFSNRAFLNQMFA